jgi:hypothetical protein
LNNVSTNIRRILLLSPTTFLVNIKISPFNFGIATYQHHRTQPNHNPKPLTNVSATSNHYLIKSSSTTDHFNSMSQDDTTTTTPTKEVKDAGTPTPKEAMFFLAILNNMKNKPEVSILLSPLPLVNPFSGSSWLLTCKYKMEFNFSPFNKLQHRLQANQNTDIISTGRLGGCCPKVRLFQWQDGCNSLRSDQEEVVRHVLGR